MSSYSATTMSILILSDYGQIIQACLEWCTMGKAYNYSFSLYSRHFVGSKKSSCSCDQGTESPLFKTVWHACNAFKKEWILYTWSCCHIDCLTLSLMIIPGCLTAVWSNLDFRKYFGLQLPYFHAAWPIANREVGCSSQQI